MPEAQSRPSVRAAFVAGVLTVVGTAALLGAFAAHRLGAGRLEGRAENAVFQLVGAKAWRVLDLPSDVRRELQQAGGVLDNAGRDRLARSLSIDHETMLVRRDPDLGWVQRPGVELEAFVLLSRDAFNLDPPVLFLRAGSVPGPATSRFLADHARLRYRFSTDEWGHRRTVPRVDCERVVLVVGDSVAFGVGVSDEATVVSQLQSLVGSELRLVNAGVGGYSGEQALAYADELSRERRYAGLVYLTSQNDFMLDPRRSHAEQAEAVLDRAEALRDRFSGRVAFLAVSYLEFAARDLLRYEGWTPDEIEQTSELYRALPRLARRRGLAYVDWLRLVEAERRANASIFAVPALYADHGHLSPRGSEVAAQAIFAALTDARGAPEAPTWSASAGYRPKRSAVGELVFSSSSITLPNGSRP